MRGESGIVPVMEVGNNNSGFGSGFGNNGDWAWIIILFLIFGFNGRGFGNGGGGFGGGYGIPENFALQTDFATLERKLDGVNNGLCDGFYNMAQQFSNTNQNIFRGTADLQQTLCQGFSGLNQGLVAQGYETRLGVNSLNAALANCCCDIRQEIADCCCKTQTGLKDISYNIAMGNNAITNAMCLNTRDIIENQNANYRALHEELIANKLEMKNDRIAELQTQVNSLQLKASQEAQNNYLIAKLGPKCPEPAYVVNGPTPVNFPTNCCNTFAGFNNCGCGNY